MESIDNSDQEGPIVNDYIQSIDHLYEEIYYSFERKFGITCSEKDFDKYINRDIFRNHLSASVKDKGTHPNDVLPDVLGLVIPGVAKAAGGNSAFSSPAGKGAAMFDIATMLFPGTAHSAKVYADMFGLDLDSSVELLADEVGKKMKSITSIPGANIFSNRGRGPGGNSNDEGELNTVPVYDSYFHHEPVKNTLNWNLDIENTQQGEEPFWKSGPERVCWVSKFNQLHFPNDDEALKEYYEILVPILRNSVQANKRYTANVSTFFTFEVFKNYLNEIIDAVSTYYFFANGFAYCNEPGLVNNNEALRYLRQNLFSTVQLQRFQQLGQLIDSLPIPQTLLNAVAQYHGWYSNSQESGATLYTNVPHGVFRNNTIACSIGQQASLDKLQSDIIQVQINKLNTAINGTDFDTTQKFLGLLLNTIPGWRTSSVGGSAFATDLYDEAHWNEFMNSPTVNSVHMYHSSNLLSNKTYSVNPAYTNDTDTHHYWTTGCEIPGYLQAYWTPINWNSDYSTLNHHGIVKSQPRTISSMMTGHDQAATGPELLTDSNMMIWTNTVSLKNSDGTLTNKGFTLYPTEHTAKFGSNIGSPNKWSFDAGQRTGGGLPPNFVNVLATCHVTNQQPPKTSNVTNMSLNQCFPNRSLALQKLLDIQEFYSIKSPTANRESKPRGRKGRKSSTVKVPATEVEVMDNN